jgi:hypothetical protein
MVGSVFASLVCPSSERSLLVSESSEWKGSVGAGTPTEGRLKRGVGGLVCRKDSEDDAELDGYEYDNGVSGAGGEANWTCLVWVVARADDAAPGQHYKLRPRDGHSATYCRCSMVESGHLRRCRRLRCLMEQTREFVRRVDHGGTDSIQTSGRLRLIMVAMSARMKCAPASSRYC